MFTLTKFKGNLTVFGCSYYGYVATKSVEVWSRVGGGAKFRLERCLKVKHSVKSCLVDMRVQKTRLATLLMRDAGMRRSKLFQRK